MDVCIFHTAPGRLRFHEIAHRNGSCVERTDQAQSQGTNGSSPRYSLPLLSPTFLQCLRLLPPVAAPLLPDLILTPYMPVPDTNGEEWDRLEAATGIDALLELIMHGEYNGQDAVRRQKESVDLRATAVGVFEVLFYLPSGGLGLH